MSYAITIERVELGDGFADTLRAILSHDHATRRAAEQESLRNILVESSEAMGRAPRGLVVARDLAVKIARDSALKYNDLEALANAAEAVHLQHKDDPQLGPPAAKKFVDAEAARVAQRAVYTKDEKDANDAHQRLRDLIPDTALEHVGPIFDKQIEAGILAAAALVKAGVLGSAKAAKIQLAGHVEQDTTAFCSVHVWPVG